MLSAHRMPANMALYTLKDPTCTPHRLPALCRILPNFTDLDADEVMSQRQSLIRSVFKLLDTDDRGYIFLSQWNSIISAMNEEPMDDTAPNDVDPRIGQLDIERFTSDWPDEQLSELHWFVESVTAIESDINVRWKAAAVQWKELVLFLADQGVTNYILSIQPDHVARWLSIRIKRGMAHTKFFHDIDPSILQVGYTNEEVEELWRDCPIEDIRRSYDLLIPFSEQLKVMFKLADICKSISDTLDNGEDADGWEQVYTYGETLCTLVRDLAAFVSCFQNEPEFLRTWAAFCVHNYGLPLLTASLRALNQLDGIEGMNTSSFNSIRAKIIVTLLYLLDFRFESSDAVIDVMLGERVKKFLEQDVELTNAQTMLQGTVRLDALGTGSTNLAPLADITISNFIKTVTAIPCDAGRLDAIDLIIEHEQATLPQPAVPGTGTIADMNEDSMAHGFPEYRVNHNELMAAQTPRSPFMSAAVFAVFATRLDLSSEIDSHEHIAAIRAEMLRLLPALLIHADAEDAPAQESRARDAGFAVLKASRVMSSILRVIRQKSGRIVSSDRVGLDDLLAHHSAIVRECDTSHVESFSVVDESPDRDAAICCIASLSAFFGPQVVGDLLLDCPKVLETLLSMDAPPVILLRTTLSRADSGKRLAALEERYGGEVAVRQAGDARSVLGGLSNLCPILLPLDNRVFVPSFQSVIKRNHILSIFAELYQRVTSKYGIRVVEDLSATTGAPNLSKSADSDETIQEELSLLLARAATVSESDIDSLVSTVWDRIHLLWTLENPAADSEDFSRVYHHLTNQLVTHFALLDLFESADHAALTPFQNFVRQLHHAMPPEDPVVVGKNIRIHCSTCRPSPVMVVKYKNGSIPELLKSILSVIEDIAGYDRMIVARRAASVALDQSLDETQSTHAPVRERLTSEQTDLMSLLAFYLSVNPSPEVKFSGPNNASAAAEWVGVSPDDLLMLAEGCGTAQNISGALFKTWPVRRGVRLYTAKQHNLSIVEVGQKFYLAVVDKEDAPAFFGARKD
ncbi:EF-hand calcium-binding domain [Carpediemonas membranifera]|uniref:EF-hand calcium-binding domain n=1 Tax=Carpediemonas membranifera TaxID=201153 RepID=A0A8J6AQD5_9EUKA|nr:EF-hand calcium-binding domain [Carpediemonas membranifera]|eukprot:KAG9390898.1 EF-hand calcium-binding domain [Carpediemonas membranifera]